MECYLLLHQHHLLVQIIKAVHQYSFSYLQFLHIYCNLFINKKTFAIFSSSFVSSSRTLLEFHPGNYHSYYSKDIHYHIVIFQFFSFPPNSIISESIISSWWSILSSWIKFVLSFDNYVMCSFVIVSSFTSLTVSISESLLLSLSKIIYFFEFKFFNCFPIFP